MKFKLATDMKPSISNLRVLFCPCAVRIATVHVGTKALNIRHQVQKGFCSIFVGITQHQNVYLVYVRHRQNIKSSYNVVFDESLSSALVYMSQPYAEAMDMLPAVSYIPYDTSARGQTGNIITFSQFEEGNLLSKNRDYTEISNKSDDDSNLAPLISEEEMDTMSSCDESNSEPMSTDMREDIRDGSQYNTIINRREARYNICDRIK